MRGLVACLHTEAECVYIPGPAEARHPGRLPEGDSALSHCPDLREHGRKWSRPRISKKNDLDVFSFMKHLAVLVTVVGCAEYVQLLFGGEVFQQIMDLQNAEQILAPDSQVNSPKSAFLK
jgi:hypothetical protein